MNNQKCKFRIRNMNCATIILFVIQMNNEWVQCPDYNSDVYSVDQGYGHYNSDLPPRPPPPPLSAFQDHVNDGSNSNQMYNTFDTNFDMQNNNSFQAPPLPPAPPLNEFRDISYNQMNPQINPNVPLYQNQDYHPNEYIQSQAPQQYNAIDTQPFVPPPVPPPPVSSFAPLQSSYMDNNYSNQPNPGINLLKTPEVPPQPHINLSKGPDLPAQPHRNLSKSQELPQQNVSMINIQKKKTLQRNNTALVSNWTPHNAESEDKYIDSPQLVKVKDHVEVIPTIQKTDLYEPHIHFINLPLPIVSPMSFILPFNSGKTTEYPNDYSQIVKQCIQNKKGFDDESFPGNEPLHLKCSNVPIEISWRRIKDINPNACFFGENGPSINDINQGYLADSNFLVALSGIVKNSSLFKKVVPSQDWNKSSYDPSSDNLPGL